MVFFFAFFEKLYILFLVFFIFCVSSFPMYMSPYKSVFHFFVFATCAVLLWSMLARWYERKAKKDIDQSTKLLAARQIQLDQIGQADAFNKLEFARHIVRQQTASTKRWERIQSIIAIIQELQSVNFGGDVIRLYDFTINANELVIQGETVNIALLYHTIPWSHTSLFDTFKNLDFVRRLSVREYKRAGTDSVWFTLTAQISF